MAHQIIEYSSSSPGPLDPGSETVMTSSYQLAAANPKRRAGRTKFKETRHPVFRGVRRRNGGKWVCEVRNNKSKSKSSRLWLGTYPTAEMAARAHDVAALALRGCAACLNFADSAWRLPVPSSGSDGDIRAAATAAAEAFRDHQDTDEYSKSCSYDDVSDAESSSEGKRREEEDDFELESSSGGVYLDEEAIFFMPELLVDMAEGLLMPPPPIMFGDGLNLDGGDCHFCGHDISIWNF